MHRYKLLHLTVHWVDFLVSTYQIEREEKVLKYWENRRKNRSAAGQGDSHSVSHLSLNDDSDSQTKRQTDSLSVQSTSHADIHVGHINMALTRTKTWSAGNAFYQDAVGFNFASDWLEGWHDFSKPITIYCDCGFTFDWKCSMHPFQLYAKPNILQLFT